jgi:hypothetical protein
MSLSFIDHSLGQLLHVKLIFIYKFNVLLSVGIIICDYKFLVNNQSRPGPARKDLGPARPVSFCQISGPARPGPARGRPGPSPALHVLPVPSSVHIFDNIPYNSLLTVVCSMYKKYIGPYYIIWDFYLKFCSFFKHDYECRL